MNGSSISRVFRSSGVAAKAWAPLLLLLLMSLMVTGVLAQDSGDGDVPDPTDLKFVEADDTISPENAQAAAGEVWLRVNRDTFVASNDPNRNFGSDSVIRFGTLQGGLGVTRPMFFFDVRSAIPSNARIERAEFHFYLAANSDTDTSRGFAAHTLTQSWSEGFVTWNNQPQWGPEIARGTLNNSPGWHVTNVTDLVRQWYSNPSGNNGLILVGDERPDQNFERSYFSKESSSGLYPRLYVKFDTSRDDRPPNATVIQPSSGSWSPADFVVAWEGNDPPNSDGSPGSGIRWYDGYYSTNQGNTWKIGRAQVTSTQTNVTGAPHLQRYDFYVRARDNAGNEGPAPSGPGSSQTWTRVDAEPPAAHMNPLPEFTPHSSFQISWTDTKENNESGIRYYDVQYRANNGSWLQLVYHTNATSTTFTQGQNGVRYDFRARAVDRVGNEQPWGEPQATTTVWLEPVAYIVPFTPPAIYQKLNGPEAGDGFTVSWEGRAAPGNSIVSFDVEFQRPNSSTWLSWLAGTTQTSAKFELGLGDPDGIYQFRVRARDNQGNTGSFLADGQGQIIVDRFEPFMAPQAYLPIIIAD